LLIFDKVWCLPVFTDDYETVEITKDMCCENESTRLKFCDIISVDIVLPLLKYETVEDMSLSMSRLSSLSTSDDIRSPRNSSKRTRIDSTLEQKSESTIQQLKMMKISATNFLKDMEDLRDDINDQCACSILLLLELQITKDMPDIYEAINLHFGKDSGWKLKFVNTGIQLLMKLSSSSSSSSSISEEKPIPSSHATAISEFLKYIADNNCN